MWPYPNPFSVATSVEIRGEMVVINPLRLLSFLYVLELDPRNVFVAALQIQGFRAPQLAQLSVNEFIGASPLEPDFYTELLN